jgi:hypothetical protein
MTNLSKTDRKRLSVLQRQHTRLLKTLPTDPAEYDPLDINRIVRASEEMGELCDDMLKILDEADVKP